MSNRTMYDSVDVTAIPRGAQMVAGYVDGHWQTVEKLKSQFPRATLITITVTGATLDAHVADVERGDLNPQSGAAWARKKVEAGQHPTLYTSAGEWPVVQAAVKAAGIDGKVSYWIARWNGRANIPTGAVACQYADPASSGGNYDVSAVLGYWPGVDPAPTKPRMPWLLCPVLKEGSRKHGWVAKAQRLLKLKVTPQLVVDGIFGPKTALAVKEVQCRNGWPETGHCGPWVWRWLLK